MQRLLVFILTLLPICSLAQPRLSLGLTAGADAVIAFNGKSSIGPLSSQTLKSETPMGIAATLKGVLDLRKWQFGVGVEGGRIIGDVPREVGFRTEAILARQNRSNPYIFAYTVEGQNIAAPYFLPHLFVHYKFNLTDNTYLYAGPMGGYTFAKNDMTYTGRNTSRTAGGNFGTVLGLRDGLGIDIVAGYRKVWVREYSVLKVSSPSFNPNAIQTVYAPVYGGTEDYVAEAINNYNLTYLTLQIGVRARL